MDRRGAGKSGEDQARAFLERRGYRFLAANFRTRLGELDLVMRQKDAVVFVEVKSRQSNDFARPYEAVTLYKQRRLAKAAVEFLKSQGLTKSACRFDVVSIGPDGIEHLENAFETAGYTL
jgi:putative endonuclease